MSAFNGIMQRDAQGRIASRLPEYFIKRDILTIQENAQYVINLDKDNVHVHHNENAHLNVIAVVGDGYYNSPVPQKGVLLEIGFLTTRPYALAKRAQKLQNPGLKIKFRERKKYFSLTPEQYQRIAPTIFKLLQTITDKQCSRRHCNAQNPFYAPTVKTWWSRSYRKTLQYSAYRPKVYGMRFSCAHSRNDIFLLQDIIATSLNSREICNFLQGFASYINMRLKKYKGYKRDFHKLKGAQEILEQTSLLKLPQYLVVEMLENYLPNKRKNYFWDELCKLFNWDQVPPKQLILAQQCFPNLHERTGKIQIRLHKEYSNYTVFEILPTFSPTQ